MSLKTRHISELLPQPRSKQLTPITDIGQSFYELAQWLKRQGRGDRIILPLPPNVANARMHWRTADAAKKLYRENCDTLAVCRLLPTVPAIKPLRVTVTALLVLRRAMDDDNALARCKWPLDWLKHNGYLFDDDREHCRYSGIPAQRITRLEPSRIEFKLEEVSEWYAKQ